jgi:RNA polymerase sigma-70 factor (ECF subfamily)
MRFSKSAVDQLYRSHNHALRGLARRQVGREDAEDVVQEAYLRLLELENAGRVADARGYLYRIAANVAMDLLRKRKTRSSCVVENVEFEAVAAATSSFATTIEEAILARRIQSSLACLPRDCRETFILSRLYGMTIPEIAGRLGISSRTVNRHINRAMDRLQSAFDGVAATPDAKKAAPHSPGKAQPRVELQL